MRLREKVTIITGSTRGIGEEYARLFCREGAMKITGLFVPNPRNLTRVDVEAIYRMAW